MAAVLFPREGGSTEEALFRSCVGGGARWVRTPFLYLQDLETGFLRKGTETVCSHHVGMVVCLIGCRGIVLILFPHHEFESNYWRKTPHFKASWQDGNARGSLCLGVFCMASFFRKPFLLEVEEGVEEIIPVFSFLLSVGNERPTI